ncbi:hypothetical protein CVT24_008900 [Panaeolus cyanescens]|uniref:6-phosphogluconate dehydrogenase NADP-binding domain-containing protein n=1 Tax=Panaeolus cyanescens TaxID=181874 RepID=A0A409VES6_9AGAR|nr:hypothetical protein CVT24_008900 [Panaeolus cyanescens]
MTNSQKVTPNRPDDVPFSRPISPTTFALQIGFIGLGNMGYCMARNLARYSNPTLDHPMLVWNRTESKAVNLVKEVGSKKLRIAKCTEQIAQECDVVTVSLADDAAVRSVYQGLTDELKANPPNKIKIFVETSTIIFLLQGKATSHVITSRKVTPTSLQHFWGHQGCNASSSWFKDIHPLTINHRHIRRLTAEHDAPMPAIDVANQHLVTARAIHTRKFKEGAATLDALDWSGIIAGTRIAAGLDGFNRAQEPIVVQVDD